MNVVTDEFLLSLFFILKGICIHCCWHWAGRGGASIYGKQFDDEITDELKHTGQYNTSVFNSVCVLSAFLRVVNIAC